MDSGCNSHMTGNENIFINMDDSIIKQVQLGNNKEVDVMGKGTIVVKSKKGQRYIHDVFYVPGLALDLLSIGKLVEKGYSTLFENSKCVIYDKNKSNQIVAKIGML